MGAARSAFRRTLRAPVETRAKLDKVLGSQPEVAPKHQSTKNLLEKTKSENQTEFEAHNEKNNEFLHLLKDIHVSSVKLDPVKSSKSNPHPAEQTTRLTSDQFMYLFQQRMANPQEWTEEKIAEHFKLPRRTVENILKYYSTFNVELGPEIPQPLAEITY